MDETLKLDELESLSNRFTKLNIYFLDKISAKDISEYDKERFSDISSKFALRLFEYGKNKNINKDEIKYSVNFQIEKLEDNIKNS